MRCRAACLRGVVTLSVTVAFFAVSTTPAPAQTIYDLLFGSPDTATQTKPKTKTNRGKVTKPKRTTSKRAKKKSGSRSGLGVGAKPLMMTPDPPTRKDHSIVQQVAQQPSDDSTGSSSVVTLLAGEPGQTSLHLAHDLSVVVEAYSNMRVLPIVGNGGIRNVKDLVSHASIDLAITYGDVLAEIQSDETLKAAYQNKIRPIAKLCNAEIHILAGSQVEDLAALAGKRVNFGPEGSASQFTARQIFKGLGIAPVEVSLHTRDAIPKIKTGELTAMVILAGKPSAHLAGLSRSEGYRILSIPYLSTLPGHYLPSRLSTADYPALITPSDDGIDTLAVGEILIARAPDESYARTRQVASFVKTFFQNLEQLRLPPRHPKWHETALSAPVQGWQTLTAAQDALSTLKPNNSGLPDATIINTKSVETEPTQNSAKPIQSNDPQQKLLQELTKSSSATTQ